MTIRIAALLLASLLFCRAGFADNPSAKFPPQASLDSITNELMTKGKVPGGAIAIYANERIHMQTFGQRGFNDPRPVNAETVFRIASLSKTFASGLASVLVRSGDVRWDSKMQSLMPELKFAKRSTTKDLQFQHLLSNSSGVLPYAFDQQLESSASLASILRQMPKAPIVCEPGRCYGYQNSLFSAAAVAMEKQTGTSYENLLRYRLFAPLGMAESSVGFDALKSANNLALPHIQANKQWQQVELSPGYYQAMAAAGVNSSISDMGLWLAAQLGSRPDVLDATQLHALQTPRVVSDKFTRSKNWARTLAAEHYGYGWRVLQIGPSANETLLFHSGWVKGYSAQISYSPKHRIGLVILLNAERWLDSIAVDFWCETLQAKMTQAICKPKLATESR
jgi:beta-lactamase class C